MGNFLYPVEKKEENDDSDDEETLQNSAILAAWDEKKDISKVNNQVISLNSLGPMPSPEVFDSGGRRSRRNRRKSLAHPPNGSTDSSNERKKHPRRSRRKSVIGGGYDVDASTKDRKIPKQDLSTISDIVEGNEESDKSMVSEGNSSMEITDDYTNLADSIKSPEIKLEDMSTLANEEEKMSHEEKLNTSSAGNNDMEMTDDYSQLTATIVNNNLNDVVESKTPSNTDLKTLAEEDDDNNMEVQSAENISMEMTDDYSDVLKNEINNNSNNDNNDNNNNNNNFSAVVDVLESNLSSLAAEDDDVEVENKLDGSMEMTDDYSNINVQNTFTLGNLLEEETAISKEFSADTNLESKISIDVENNNSESKAILVEEKPKTPINVYKTAMANVTTSKFFMENSISPVTGLNPNNESISVQNIKNHATDESNLIPASQSVTSAVRFAIQDPKFLALTPPPKLVSMRKCTPAAKVTSMVLPIESPASVLRQNLSHLSLGTDSPLISQIQLSISSETKTPSTTAPLIQKELKYEINNDDNNNNIEEEQLNSEQLNYKSPIVSRINSNIKLALSTGKKLVSPVIKLNINDDDDIDIDGGGDKNDENNEVSSTPDGIDREMNKSAQNIENLENLESKTDHIDVDDNTDVIDVIVDPVDSKPSKLSLLEIYDLIESAHAKSLDNEDDEDGLINTNSEYQTLSDALLDLEIQSLEHMSKELEMKIKSSEENVQQLENDLKSENIPENEVLIKMVNYEAVETEMEILSFKNQALHLITGILNYLCYFFMLIFLILSYLFKLMMITIKLIIAITIL